MFWALFIPFIIAIVWHISSQRKLNRIIKQKALEIKDSTELRTAQAAPEMELRYTPERGYWMQEKDPEEEPYRSEITPMQQKIIDRQMDEIVEKFPNGEFVKTYPHYLENYLNRIDLSELDESLGK